MLLYTITRDKLCPELGEEGTSLLVGMLVTPHQPEAALEGKQARDMDKLKARARYICMYVMMCRASYGGGARDMDKLKARARYICMYVMMCRVSYGGGLGTWINSRLGLGIYVCM